MGNELGELEREPRDAVSRESVGHDLRGVWRVWGAHTPPRRSCLETDISRRCAWRALGAGTDEVDEQKNPLRLRMKSRSQGVLSCGSHRGQVTLAEAVAMRDRVQ